MFIEQDSGGPGARLIEIASCLECTLSPYLPHLCDMFGNVFSCLMTKDRDARKLSEWWQKRYAWEHCLVGVLVGFLLAASFVFPLKELLSAVRRDVPVQSVTLNPTLPTPLYPRQELTDMADGIVGDALKYVAQVYTLHR